jgi:hypothetical protein
MTTDDSATQGPDERTASEDDLTAFINLLNELKATGCTLLVVGDVPRGVFTRASSRLLGEETALRYRLLAVTDAAPRSVTERLPDPDATPRPLSATTRVLNHAGAPRSVTVADSGASSGPADIEEIRISDPELQGLQSELVDAIGDAASDADALRAADLRVGIDSLDPLLEQCGEAVVKRCLDVVGEHVRDRRGMAHYVLTNGYDTDRVQRLVPTVDAVIELRTVSPDEYDHEAQQRWHVPRRDITTEWAPL